MMYHAPAWLPGGHLQTIFPALCLKPDLPDLRRERWSTPDQDFIDIDFLDSPGSQALVVLFHGLEGSSRSHYARALLRLLAQRGYAGAIPHFRGCSGELNQAPRFYHSGDSQEIGWILQRMRELAGPRKLYAAGVSLGGNALLRWLGEQQHQASLVDAAAAVSAPLNLAAGGAALGKGMNRLYTQMFLRTLKPKCELKLQQYPGLFNRQAMLSARNLYEFDNVVTAPLHGYRDTDDYWQRASAGPILTDIRVPTLVLNARNDPFLPAHHLPQRASSSVLLEYPVGGGHVGFAQGQLPGHVDWLPQRLLRFFEQAL